MFDVVRRFAQPLGIHLDNWEDRIIETEKGIVRLLPVGERGAQLFGQDGTDLVAERLEREPTGALQLGLFPDRADAAAPELKSWAMHSSQVVSSACGWHAHRRVIGSVPDPM